MAKCWRAFLADWEDWRARTTDFRELDSERVLALVELSGRHRASRLEVGQLASTTGANLFHVRDGKVTRFVLFLDRDRALADLGLAGGGPIGTRPIASPIATTVASWRSARTAAAYRS
jgi:hypothetical protein